MFHCIGRRFFLCILWVFLSVSLVYAAPNPVFSITPYTPTSMLLPANGTAIVQYQVTNQTQITRTLTIKPITGASQIVTGTGVCTSPFTLNSKESCLLTLEVNGSQISTHIKGGPIVCKTVGPGNNNPDPFLCSWPSQENSLFISVIGAVPDQHVYITNWIGNTISLCNVSTFDGSLNNCVITANGTPFVNPEAVGLNADGSYLYVANIGDSTVYYCGVNNTDSTLSACTSTGSGFSGADGVAINGAQTYAYVSNAGSGVSLCLVDSITGALGGCSATGNGFHTPSDLTLNKSGTIAYVSDLANLVSICPIDASSGALTCTNTIGGFDQPEGITLHPSGQFAYITNNGSNNVSVCKIDAITGNLHSCMITEGHFNGFGNLAFNSLGTRAYIPNMLLNKVFVCFVNTNTGALSLCKDSNGGVFDGPSGILLK
jgi:DNA-binding beta-propeller fold protein YncE